MCLRDACAYLLTVSIFGIFEESEVDEKAKQLQSKDEIVAQKSKIIKVNSDVITALQKEVDSLQVGPIFCIRILLHC